MWNFMLKYSWKKKTWKVFFGHQSLGDQTSIRVSQMAWIYGGGGGGGKFPRGWGGGELAVFT